VADDMTACLSRMRMAPFSSILLPFSKTRMFSRMSHSDTNQLYPLKLKSTLPSLKAPTFPCDPNLAIALVEKARPAGVVVLVLASAFTFIATDEERMFVYGYTS
jgi:hypothetical protein